MTNKLCLAFVVPSHLKDVLVIAFIQEFNDIYNHDSYYLSTKTRHDLPLGDILCDKQALFIINFNIHEMP